MSLMSLLNSSTSSKLLIYRREADIGDLVEALELAHDEFAQLRRRHLSGRRRFISVILDALDRSIDMLDADRSFA